MFEQKTAANTIFLQSNLDNINFVSRITSANDIRKNIRQTKLIFRQSLDYGIRLLAISRISILLHYIPNDNR